MSGTQNDAALALLLEAAGLHSNLISQTVSKLRNGELWNLGDQYGEIIAGNCQLARDRLWIRFLHQVRCKIGNPSLSAVRVIIEVGDIRLKASDECFSVVTLYNNIYYFPVESRVSLLQHIRQFIKLGGFLLLITCCQGGSLGVEVLNLWGAATLTGGRLPSKHELISQLHHAGFQDIQTLDPRRGALRVQSAPWGKRLNHATRK